MKYWIVSAGLFVLMACGPSRKAGVNRDDGKIGVVFVQVNDVYEIAPVSGGAYGGIARVATIKKDALKTNPNTFLVMAGDFLSPSVYNSLKYDGKRIRGRQMVDAMNAANFDIAIFGNHEFDITEDELQDRINESKFQWVSSNAFHKRNDSIAAFIKDANGGRQPLPLTRIITVRDNDGTIARIGIIGLTIPSNKASYVSYTDPVQTAKDLYPRLRDSCDAVIAITHQTLASDIRLAEEVPGLTLIIGGHEHDMRFTKTGNVYISKAHANARSAYMINVNIDKKKKVVNVVPQLKVLDKTVLPDSVTNLVVSNWMNIAAENYSSVGFSPSDIIVSKGDSLEGRELFTRRTSTNLTQLIVKAMAEACPDAELAIVNAGSIRVDDILYPPISQYDILRSLPFGGPIREAEMKGSLLIRVLDVGKKNESSGGFLHYYPVEWSEGEWILNNQPIDPERVYRVAISDYLLTGLETNLGFLNKNDPGMVKIFDEITSPSDPRSDIRLAIIKYLEKKN